MKRAGQHTTRAGRGGATTLAEAKTTPIKGQPRKPRIQALPIGDRWVMLTRKTVLVRICNFMYDGQATENGTDRARP